MVMPWGKQRRHAGADRCGRKFVGLGFLLPARNGELFRWCLAHGLRVVQPMTLMSLGLYNEPGSIFLPSIKY